MERASQWSNSIKTDMVISFGCDEGFKSLCRRVEVGEPELQRVLRVVGESRHSMLVNGRLWTGKWPENNSVHRAITQWEQRGWSSVGRVQRKRPVHSAHSHRGPTMCLGLTAPRIQADPASAHRTLKMCEFHLIHSKNTGGCWKF